jgi:hypothetical protein
MVGTEKTDINQGLGAAIGISAQVGARLLSNGEIEGRRKQGQTNNYFSAEIVFIERAGF